jgi:hypothetical protein
MLSACSYAQTLGSPKPIHKDNSSTTIQNPFSTFGHNSSFDSFRSPFRSNSTSSSTGLRSNSRIPLIFDSRSYLKANAIKLQSEEYNDNFQFSDEVEIAFSQSDNLVKNMEDSAEYTCSISHPDLTNNEIITLVMPSAVTLDENPGIVSSFKQKIFNFGFYTGAGIFNLSKSGATGGVYKLGMTFWQNISERLKIRESMDLQFAQGWVLSNDILREYYTNDTISGYRLDKSGRYTFQCATITAEAPFGLIYTPRVFFYLYSGIGIWFTRQHFNFTRTDTYKLENNKNYSAVKFQSIEPVGSLGFLFLTQLFNKCRFEAITIDLGYHLAKNEKAMNSSFFMDIDNFTHCWMINIGFMI